MNYLGILDTLLYMFICINAHIFFFRENAERGRYVDRNRDKDGCHYAAPDTEMHPVLKWQTKQPQPFYQG